MILQKDEVKNVMNSAAHDRYDEKKENERRKHALNLFI